MKRLRSLAIITSAMMFINMYAEITHPKLVVGIVIDQMRWDYLYRYEKHYGEGDSKDYLMKDSRAKTHVFLMCHRLQLLDTLAYIREVFLLFTGSQETIS